MHAGTPRAEAACAGVTMPPPAVPPIPPAVGEVIAALPAPALAFAKDGACLVANRAARALLGGAGDWRPDATEMFPAGMWWTGEDDAAAPRTVTVLAADGSPRQMEASAGPLPDPPGGVVVVLRAAEGPPVASAESDGGPAWTPVRGIPGSGEAPAALMPLLAALADGPDPLVVVDREGLIRYVNPAHRAVTGWRPADLLGAPFVDVLHPEDAIPPMAELVRTATAAEGWLGAPARVRCADGDWIWMESLIVDRLADPGVAAMVFIARDTTPRMVLERTTAIVAAAARAVAGVDDVGAVQQELVRAVCEQTGAVYGSLWRLTAAGDALRSRATWSRDEERLRAFAGAAYERRIADGVGMSVKVWTSGEPIWIGDVVESPVVDGATAAAAGIRSALAAPLLIEGRMAGVLVIGFARPRSREGWLVEVVTGVLAQIDQVLAARQAVSRLRASEARFRAFADRIPSPVYIKDADGNYRFVNASTEALIGLSAARMLGRTDEELFGEDAAAIVAADRRALAEGPLEVLERGPGFAEGRGRAYLSVKFPLIDADGALTLGGISIDVTERERYEHEIAERAERERVLREREERFRGMVEQGGDVVIFAGATGVVQYASPSVQGVLGRPPEAFAGHDAAALFAPVDMAAVRAALACVGEGIQRFEARAIRADGSVAWLDVLASTAPDGDGPPGIVLGARDVSARKALEARLRHSETLFRTAFVHTSVGASLQDLDGRWRLVNPAMCRMLGYEEWELLGLRYQDVTHPDDIAHDMAESVRLLAGEIDSCEMVKRYARKDGQTVWALVNVALVKDADGAPRSFVTHAQDITERREAETRLAFQAELLDRARDAIFAREWNGSIVYWNRGAELLYGYSRDEAVGRISHDLLRTKYPVDVAEIRAALLRDGVWEGELEHERADGTRIPVESRRVLVEHGDRRTLLEINRDITERRRHEASLREALARAEEASWLKTAFLLAVSHELRTPMNAIIGYAHLLLDGFSGPLTDAQRADVEQIAGSADHLLGLIEDLLDVPTVEAGATRLAFGAVDVGTVLEQARALLAPEAAARGIALVAAAPPGLPTVRADPPRVLQMVLNLGGNAVKFTERGSVTLRAEASEPGWVCIAVEDTGIGIAEDDRRRIFEPFFQADAGTTRRRGGIGLGLTITGALAAAHGGSIEAESAPGRGSRFTIRLPVAGPPMPAGTEPAGPDA